MRGLKGKVGIVAGGGRGIGAATVKRLCEEGAHVIVGDIQEDWANEAAEAASNAGEGKAIGVHLDGTKAESQQAIVDRAVKEFGGLDFFHSNLAGGTEGDVDILNCPVEVFDRQVAINTKSHFLATQAALPAMLERGGGSFIYVSSGAASGGAAWQVAYPMTKNAIHPLARHVARKWGPKGIRSNVICPGLIMTEAVAQHLSDEQVAGMQKQTPSSRLGQADDIAAAVAFLASDDSGFVNGQVWHVNGGTQMRD